MKNCFQSVKIEARLVFVEENRDPEGPEEFEETPTRVVGEENDGGVYRDQANG